MVVHGGIVCLLKQCAWALIENVYAKEILHDEAAARGQDMFEEIAVV